jgi:2-polyprenyl-3-methyl-5-hydroxy-6-metoxy-1,4-benzoquinol methylase
MPFAATRLGTIAVALLLAESLTAARQLAAQPPDSLIRSLESPGRVASQRVDEVLAQVGLRSGMVVADIGTGTGVFARPIARAVGPAGKVYAVDIEPKLLDYLATRARQDQLTNIEVVLGTPGDARLPRADADLAFFNDVLHHIEHRAEYIKALAKYMKSDSRMAVVEFDSNVQATIEGIPTLKREEVAGWMRDAGFPTAKESPRLFNNKWLIVYSR